MAKKTTPVKPSPPELVISRIDATQKLNDRIDQGEKFKNEDVRNYEAFEKLEKVYNIWDDYNFELLQRIFSNDSFAQRYQAAKSYAGLFGGDYDLSERLENFYSDLKCKLEELESLRGRLDLIPEPAPEQKEETIEPVMKTSSKKVFVVHGHDEAARESVARYLEHLNLEPVILHEQPSSGQTIIEKFEKHADVSFAVVLLTPDDVGASKKSEAELKPRARQNVILELGYFIGKLGRHSVCALHKEVELPSDFSGVVYVNFDTAGGWKLLLGKELRATGFDVDLNSIK